MMTCNHEKQKLMRQVQMADFALVEANLYLNTHPDDRDAMEYFAEKAKQAKRTREEYTVLYGPITVVDSMGMDSWTWAETPWPWEMEA